MTHIDHIEQVIEILYLIYLVNKFVVVDSIIIINIIVHLID